MSEGGGPYPSTYIRQCQELEEQEVEPWEAQQGLQGPRRVQVCLILGGFCGLHWMRGLQRLGLGVQVNLVL